MSAPRPLRALRPLLLAALIALSVSRATDASAADRASKIADRLVKQLDDEELGALVGLLTDACSQRGESCAPTMTTEGSCAAALPPPPPPQKGCAEVTGTDVRVPGSSGLRLLFGTPLFSTPLSGVDDLNDALATLILGMREAEPSGAAAKMRSVDGFDSASAWRTGDDFLQRREPPVAELTRRLTARAKKVVAYGQRDASLRFELVLNGWAIVLGAGAGQVAHVHPLASWSGIYYVRVPPSVGAAGGPNGKAGCLQLTDPRPAAMMITLGPSDAQFLERREVCPTEGLLVLFPSWLSHSVTRLADSAAGERIAVAFNVHGAEV